MAKSKEEIMSLPSHQRKKEFKRRKKFRKAEAKRTLPMRIKLAEESKKRIQEENKR